MIVEVNIPGRGIITMKHLLLDYNGTIACDGVIIPSVVEKIEAIARLGVKVHVVTADTHGTVREQCAHMPIEIQVFDHANASEDKRKIVEKLGTEYCVAVGNGLNDGQMFEAASLSIIVIGTEGCSAKALMKADVVCHSIEDAFDLLQKPNRLIATLRG